MAESLVQEIVCCMGYEVAGNPTQFMMERAFAVAGLDWRCLTLEVAPENLADAVRGMRAMGFRGANVTAPHNVAICPLLDELSEAARLIGGVNLVHARDGRLFGENTVGKGFIQSLQGQLDPLGKKLTLFGAGCAARAVAVELALAGATDITVVDRTASRAQELVELLNQQRGVTARIVPWEGEYAIEPDVHLVINTTPIGAGDQRVRLPVVLESLQPTMLVTDIVFQPPQTRFLREAADRACPIIDGLSTFLQQNAISFATWTGVQPDAMTMREALEEFFGF